MDCTQGTRHSDADDFFFLSMYFLKSCELKDSLMLFFPSIQFLGHASCVAGSTVMHVLFTCLIRAMRFKVHLCLIIINYSLIGKV